MRAFVIVLGTLRGVLALEAVAAKEGVAQACVRDGSKRDERRVSVLVLAARRVSAPLVD